MEKNNDKRTYGTGSYYWVDNERVRLQVSSGSGLGGRRIRKSKTVYVKTDAQAKRELQKFATEVEGQACGDNMTVNALADEYMDLYVSGLAMQTRRWYRDTFRRIRGAFGSMRLVDIKPALVEKFYKILADPKEPAFVKEEYVNKRGKKRVRQLKNGLSDSTIAHHHRALNALLTWGYEKEYMKENIMTRVKTPTFDASDARALSDDERAQFLDALDKRAETLAVDPNSMTVLSLKTFGRMALALGMRRSELCGATWGDIEYPRIHVRQSLQNDEDEGLTVCGLKTKSSDRWLEMPETLCAMLKNLRSAQVAHCLRYGLGTPEFVFTSHAGTPFHPGSMSKSIGEVFRTAGIENATLHSLRHPYVKLKTKKYLSLFPKNEPHAEKGSCMRLISDYMKDSKMSLTL